MIIFMELFIKNVFLEKHKNTKVKKKLRRHHQHPCHPFSTYLLFMLNQCMSKSGFPTELLIS